MPTSDFTMPEPDQRVALVHIKWQETAPPPTAAQAAGAWGSGIATIAVLTVAALFLLWPLGVWHHVGAHGDFAWTTTSLIFEGAWLGLLALITSVVAVGKCYGGK